MKKLSSFICFIVFATMIASCSYVQPNYEGVFMENYGKNGKSDFSLQSGKVWTVAWGTELYQVPMFEQKGDAPTLKVYAKDGGEYTVDPSYTYAPIRGQGVDIIFAYKHLYGSADVFFDNIEGSILNTRVLNAYREEARNFSTDSLMNNVAKYESAVQTRLKEEFKTKYFELQEITSNLIPPQSMKDAIEKRNLQIQKAIEIENQKKTRQNEIEIKVMESEANLKIAKLDAQANIERAKGLAPQNLKVLWIEKWDGKLPTTVSGNSDLLLQVK